MDVNQSYGQYLRAQASAQDFTKCLLYLDAIENNSDEVIGSALEKAFIVTYARNFLSSNDKGKRIPSKVPNGVLRNLGADAKELHRNIINIWRNKVIAHTELSYIVSKTHIGTAPNGGRFTGKSVKPTSNLINDSNLNEIRLLVLAVKESTAIHMKEVYRQIPDGTYTFET